MFQKFLKKIQKLKLSNLVIAHGDSFNGAMNSVKIGLCFTFYVEHVIIAAENYYYKVFLQLCI